MNPTILLNTAPTMTPYQELDLTNKAELVELEPKDLDVRLVNKYGDQKRHRHGIKRRFRVLVDGLTNDQAIQLREWKHNRKLLRINGNYNQYTKLYHEFRSADPADFSPGVQIGPDPEFDRVTGSSALATFLHDNGFIYPVDDDVPRYQSGEHGKGMLIESAANQYWGKSLPESGDLIFTLNDVSGNASYGWSSTYKNLYNEQIGSAYFIGDNNDYLEKSLASAGSPPSHSAFIYVKGEGQVSFYISGVSGGPIETGNYTLNPHQWLQLKHENFVKTGTLFFRVYARATGTQMIIGPMQIEGNPKCTSYVHNMSGTAQLRAHDELYYPIQISSFGGMINVGFTAHAAWPTSPATKQYLFHTGTAPTDFYLAYNSATGEYYFQKKSASWNVSAAPVEGAGQDTDLGAIWTHTAYYLYENGSLRDVQAISGLAYSIANGLHVGNYDTGADGWNGLVRFIRYDEYPDINQQAVIAGFWSNNDQRYWTQLTVGRDFIIESPAHRIKGGVHKSSFVLEEVKSYHTAIVGEK